MSALGSALAPLLRFFALGVLLLGSANTFALAAGTQDAVGPASLICPTCEGKGRATGDCWVCGGAGKHACAVCARFAAKAPSRGNVEWTSAAGLRAVADSLRELLEEFALPDFHLPGTPKPPKSVKLMPGDRGCPSRCVGGQLLLIDNWVDCKTCSNGKFSCAFCSRGVVRCEPCQSTGKAVLPCNDCAGTGRLRDSAALAPEVCPWCAGTNERECGSCRDSAATASFCVTCYATGQVVCEPCQGFGVNPCTKCVGRGRTGPRKEKCDTCATKGTWNCRYCKKGRVPCSNCVPEPRIRACADCNDERKHACNGCGDGAYLAWERTAQWDRARGNDARALALLQVARARCVARYATAMTKFGEMKDKEITKKVAQGVDRERDSELQRIDAAIADAKVPEKPARKDGPEAR